MWCHNFFYKPFGLETLHKWKYEVTMMADSCWSCPPNTRQQMSVWLLLHLRLYLHLLPVIRLSATYFLVYMLTRRHTHTYKNKKVVSSETESECRCEAFLGESPFYVEVGTRYNRNLQRTSNYKHGKEKKNPSCNVWWEINRLIG